MLGEPVPWPSAKPLDDEAGKLDRMLKDAERELDLTADGGEGGESEEDEDSLEWFEGAEAFGIQKPGLLAITNGPGEAGPPSSSSCAAAAAASGSASSAAAAPAAATHPTKKQKRTTADDKAAQPPPKKPKRLTPQEKAWIAGYHLLHCRAQSLPDNTIPERSWFTKARESGIEGKHLNPFVTAEGLRSHIRAVCNKTAEADGDFPALDLD